MSKEQGKDLQVAAYPDPRTNQPLSYTDVRRNTQMVQKALKELMVEKIDYGTIPGCGDKPGLLKPGAEKLAFLFKIAIFPFIEDKCDGQTVRYVIRTKAVHQPTGVELGEGVGSCSSDEEKYAWREAVVKKEWETTPEERRRIKYVAVWKEGKKTGEHTEVLQVRQNAANLENTILKMAAKRSLVDVIIKVTAASDIFHQGEDEIILDVEQPRTPAKPKEKKQSAGAEHKAQDNGQLPPIQGYAIMAARRDGICKGCGKEVKIGSQIAYSKEKGTYHHEATLNCVP